MKPIEFNNSKYICDKVALAKLTHMGLPTKKTEIFRHFDISKLLENTYSLGVESQSVSTQDDNNFYTIIINNGLIDTQNSDLPIGISAKVTSKPLIDTDNSLYYLSELFLKDEQNIVIEKSLDKALKIVNIFSGKSLFLPTNLNIVVEKGVHVDIMEVFDDNAMENSFVNINRVLDIKDDAEIYYTKLQNLKLSNTMFVNYIPRLQKNVTCKTSAIDTGANISLNILDVVLDQENSDFSFDGIIKINEMQRVGNIASMLHKKGKTTSSFTCKHILSDEAKALFEVKSIVEQEAKFSKIFQNSQSILLDNGPKISAIPQLILHTDELEAAHGATCGTLDPEALYYLMSRGINESDASNILIKAIELQIIDTISNAQIKEFAMDFLKR